MNATSKNKIIFVITKSNWGGAQRYVFDMAVASKQKGYKVIVACGGEGQLTTRLLGEDIEVVKVPGFDRDISIKNDLRAFIFLFRLFIKEKPCVIHANSSKAIIPVIAGRLSFVPKIIFTLHGLALNEDRSLASKSIITIFYWFTILFSDKVIAVSRALKRQSKRLFPLVHKKIILIHNGIIEEEFLAKADARKVLIENIKNNKNTPVIPIVSMVIGTIGELHSIKGHKYLIEGFKEASYQSSVPLFLFIIGDGELRDKLQKEIVDQKLEHCVFLCGHLNDAMRYLKAFDIFILPSISEGLPYALEEAGICGLPSIGTDTGGIPEIIVKNETGLLIPVRSSDAISKAIIKLVFEPELRKKFGHNIKTKILEEFSKNHMADSTISLYEDRQASSF